MNEQEIFAAFSVHYLRFVNIVELQSKPLLAHYTSLDAIEKISKSGDLLLSNPLFMNDLQEVRFGLTEGLRVFREEFENEEFRSDIGEERFNLIRDSFAAYFRQFEEQHALDVYVFCFSEHDPDDNDGVLSMWRGYGGNGSGVAMVVNTDFVAIRPESPLLIGKVEYKSDEEHRNWIREMIVSAKKLLLGNKISNEILFHVSYHVFQLLKTGALLLKHQGFSEEREWRVIYFPERDGNRLLSDGQTYTVGDSGIEPKLRFPIRPLPFEDPAAWTFDKIVDRIILGPSLASVLATNAVKKMFETLGRSEFATKVVASSIPYRRS